MINNTNFATRAMQRVLSLLAVIVLLAGMLPATYAQADDAKQYGYVNYNEVRFRRQANSTTPWALLDYGWVVEIRSEKRSGGVDYYYVVSNIPKHLDREYYGYINQDYITVMTDAEVASWLSAGGNEAVLNGGAVTAPGTGSGSEGGTDTPAVMTNYAKPNNASTNYYSFDGTKLTSLGLLAADGAYYVSGSATIGSDAYYIITVNGVNCYARANSMSMITTGGSGTGSGSSSEGTDSTVTEPAGALGTLRIVPDGRTNLRSTPQMISGNVVAKILEDTILPYYLIETVGSKTWYYCYYAETQEYGYILGSCIEIVSTNAGAATPAPGTSATPAPGVSGTAIGTLQIRPKGSTNVRKEPKTSTNNVITQVEQGEVLSYYATSVVNKVRWYYVYVPAKDAFGYVMGTCVTLLSGGDAATPVPTVNPGSTSVAGYIVLTHGGVNLRKEASMSSNVIGSFDKGDVFPYYFYTDVGKVRWYRVATEEGMGYIHGDFCALSDKNGNELNSSGVSTAITHVMTTKDKVYLRKKAASDAGTYGQVELKGTIVALAGNMVDNKSGYDWYYVSYNGNLGYLRSDCVRPLTQAEVDAYVSTGVLPTPTPTPTPVPKATEYIITVDDKVWIRKSPSTKAGTAGQVALGTVLQYNKATKVSGVEWYEITFDGVTRYIKGSCVKVMTDAEYNEYIAGLPTPTPSPTPTPPPDLSKMSSMALTNIEKVIVRADADSKAKQLALIYKAGTECKLTGYSKLDAKNQIWYNLTVKGTTGWIRGDLIRILTKTEAEMYDKHGDPDAKPEASYTTLQIGSSGEAVTKLQQRLVELGYLNAAYITGVYDTNTQSAIKSFQSASNLTVDGIAASVTQHALFGTVEEGYYNPDNGSSTSVILHKPELIDWYTGGIQSIFYKGAVATVTDVRTGISFKVKRWSGGHHADVEPLTAADTAAMCRIYKVKDAQEISDKNYYQRRPLLVTIGGHSYCASMYGIPHNYPAGDTISGNDFYGQFCIHFTNSQLHDGKGIDKPSSKNGYFCHMDAIKEAYETAAEKLNIK